MGKAFAQLKKVALAPTDQLTFGKFKGCRICDIVEDQYEYLIWLEKNKFVTYTVESSDLIRKYAKFVEEQRHYDEEVKPWLESDDNERSREWWDSYDDDIPF